ncbi:MAG: hypothetical protein F4X02_16545 [Chloroflexi bacterium]|nr:hypothetical protein [Chloroflexota bacterium]
MDPIERKTAAEMIDDDFADEAPHDDDEPTTEELIEMLRESLEDVKAGRTRPVRELLRELREMTAEDADPS